jgi:hypothetical protein
MSADTRRLARIEPPLGASLERAIELARRVAVDEFELIKIDASERLQRGLRRGLWLGVAALGLLVGWLAALASVVVALEPYLVLEARLALLAVSQLVLGGVALAIALRSREPGRAR